MSISGNRYFFYEKQRRKTYPTASSIVVNKNESLYNEREYHYEQLETWTLVLFQLRKMVSNHNIHLNMGLSMRHLGKNKISFVEQSIFLFQIKEFYLHTNDNPNYDLDQHRNIMELLSCFEFFSTIDLIGNSMKFIQ